MLLLHLVPTSHHNDVVVAIAIPFGYVAVCTVLVALCRTDWIIPLVYGQILRRSGNWARIQVHVVCI